LSLYKYFLGLITSILLSTAAWAQVIDTVCPGAKNIQYYVEQHSGASYQWQLAGGTIKQGNGKNEIFVDWGIISGLFLIQVIEKNMLGCAGDTISSYVWIKPFQPEIKFPKNVCKNDTAILIASGAENYLWSNKQQGSINLIKITSDTIGYLIASDSNCSNLPDTIPFQIKLGNMPTVSFSPDAGIYQKNENVLIKYKGDNNDKLRWEIKKFNIFNKNDHSFYLIVSDTGTTEIKLFAISKDGCLNSSLKLIQVKDEHLFIPNAFTPNSDGLNENFKVVQTNMQQFYLKIMNRWGEILFETNNIYDGWDGTYKGNAVQADSYLYFVEAKGYSGKEYYRKGSITLIR